MSYTWVEPFAGAAACSLRLVGGHTLKPPVAWMGGKRRYARAIADAVGVPDERPGRVVLCDAGPWGWIWPLLADQESAAHVAEVLHGWVGEHPRELWQRLADQPPAEGLHERAAQWLWLQARSASGVPVWWSGWRAVSAEGRVRSTWDRWGEANARRGSWSRANGERPAADRGPDRRWPGHQAEDGAWLASDGRGDPRPAGARAVGGRWEKGNEGRVQDATHGQRGSWRFDARPCDAQPDRLAGPSGDKSTRTGGMVNPATIAERIEAAAHAFARVAVEVHHGEAGDAIGLVLFDGSEFIAEVPRQTFAYLDPPYVGATGYGWDCPRESVLELARGWRGAGAVVAVSEAEPLDLPGWHHLELTRPGGKPEWLTLSRPPARCPARQRGLFPMEVP